MKRTQGFTLVELSIALGVWTSLESQDLANRMKRSPYSNAYVFGYAATSNVATTQRTGN